jgi:hypothetical protein
MCDLCLKLLTKCAVSDIFTTFQVSIPNLEELITRLYLMVTSWSCMIYWCSLVFIQPSIGFECSRLPERRTWRRGPTWQTRTTRAHAQQWL